MSNLLVNLLWISVSIGCFISLIIITKVVRRLKVAGGYIAESLRILSDVSLDDDSKESALQGYALKLIWDTFLMLLFLGISIALPLAAIWAAEIIGLVRVSDIATLALSWEFLVSTTIIGTLVWVVVKSFRNEGENRAQSNNYSTIDQFLHRVAFASRPVQVQLSKIEDFFLKRKISKNSTEPLFITALPRAGTTLLLECFNQLPEFTTHTYRSMPFIMIPWYWRKYSEIFAAHQSARERAHGDGMMVDFDSPEAFEEMIWMHFWPQNYLSDRIQPWGDETKSQFTKFFQSHRNKIALTSAESPTALPRYVSKNNGNIARISWILENITDAKIIVPFREPLQHAASLRNQHLNFLEIHRQDPFAAEYMAGIGHFDFGANIKPVDFYHWMDCSPSLQPEALEFWLHYWETFYAHVLNQTLNGQQSRCMLLDFDLLCVEPESVLQRITIFAGVNQQMQFLANCGRIHEPKTHSIDIETIDEALVSRVRNLYQILRIQENAPKPPTSPQ